MFRKLAAILVLATAAGPALALQMPVAPQMPAGDVVAVQSGSGTQYPSAHYRWCENRYKSYERADNTYLSHDGRRLQCQSPYM